MGDGIRGFDGFGGVDFVGGDGGSDEFWPRALRGIVILNECESGSGSVEGDKSTVNEIVG